MPVMTGMWLSENDNIYARSLLQPSQGDGSVFGSIAGIPMVLKKMLHGFPGHLMIINKENAFQDGRPVPERLRPFYP
jgi:hypothetical protein